MIGLAFKPSGVPLAICSRSMSPVERCGTAVLLGQHLRLGSFPGTRRSKKNHRAVEFSDRTLFQRHVVVSLCLTTAAHSSLTRKAFVIAHDELCLQLLHRVHRHADHDQERSATEIKRTPSPFKIHCGKCRSNQSPPIQMGKWFKPNTRDHPFRQDANQRQVHRTDKRQALQNDADVF